MDIEWWLLFGYLNHAAMNIHVKGFVWTSVFISWKYIYPRDEIAGSYVLWGNARLVSKPAAPIYIDIGNV